ncbi:MAG: hypothetical protein F6K37_33870 [Moorea sp. SIO4E2]|nr:hypothetical protein [Moorena sp. SIO4E2]
MTYSERLHPWVIIRLLPQMQRVVVARFRNRSDAEGHLWGASHFGKKGTFIREYSSRIIP